MTRQIGTHINDLIDKKIVINETINFKELNHIIANPPKDKDKEPLKFVIVIKYAEKLAEQRKQLLLYTIFEWLNNTTIRQYLTIVLTTRLITFSDLLEKRIKSRINSSILWLGRPTPPKIVEILVKRLEYRM
jgi:Cdc6-like AAA superfamily ATPase